MSMDEHLFIAFYGRRVGCYLHSLSVFLVVFLCRTVL